MVDPKRALSDVPEPHMAFWFNNGYIARNIYDLVKGIETSDNLVFHYHVNEQKDDFKSWIFDVLGDDVLAKRLGREQDRKKLLTKIRRRIKELEKLKSTSQTMLS